MVNFQKFNEQSATLIFRDETEILKEQIFLFENFVFFKMSQPKNIVLLTG